MGLIGMKVKHKAFGEGIIKEHHDNYVIISFPQGDKEFRYPDAFGTFISAVDPDNSSVIKNYIASVAAEKAAATSIEKKQEFMRRLQKKKDEKKS